MPDLVGPGPATVLVHQERWGGVRFECSAVIVRTLGECGAFEFMVLDADRDRLVVFNHHDSLIAAGAARPILEQWLAE